MTKQIIGAQGEITIIKLDAAPADFAPGNVERHAKGWIISHSESGHHHLLSGGEVMERQHDGALRSIYAILDAPARLFQDADAPHEAYDLAPGFYEFKLAREYDPFAEQARRVAD